MNRLLLAAEVLSPNTRRTDRGVKRAVYREHPVGEYWIVDLDARTIERSLPTEAQPQILAEELVWQPEGATSPLMIDVRAYFARVLDD